MRTVDQDTRPLYRRVFDDIIDQIDAGVWKAGHRLPSERSLCEHYDVSQITIRRALRDLASEGYVYSHHGLGWFVCAPATRRAPAEVALILPKLDWCSAPVVQQLLHALDQHGIDLRLAFTEGNAAAESAAVSAAVSRGTNALLIAVTGEEQGLLQRYARLLRDIDRPAVLLWHEIVGLDVPAAILDEALCMQRATYYLLELGHQRLAYAGLDPLQVDDQRRYRGFTATLWEQGLELPFDWVFWGGLSNRAEISRFHRAFRDADRPTALLCASDVLAAEAMLLLHELNLRCPEEVAIVGWGDQEFAPILPTPLTTIRLDLKGLGNAAAQLILDALAGHSTGNARVAGEIVVRSSCGQLPAGVQ